jgi:hypothetical protein
VGPENIVARVYEANFVFLLFLSPKALVCTSGSEEK